MPILWLEPEVPEPTVWGWTKFTLGALSIVLAEAFLLYCLLSPLS